MNQQETTTQESIVVRRRPQLNVRIITIGVVVIMLLGGAGYYAYAKSRPTPQQSQQKEIDSLVAAVGKLMVLPKNEQPVVATVADPDKLKDQPFFANAKKGDKVLIYNAAKKAILYDPVAQRIVDVAPLSLGATPTPKK